MQTGRLAAVACVASALGCGGVESGGPADAGPGVDSAVDGAVDAASGDTADGGGDGAPACFGDSGLVGYEFTVCHGAGECTTAQHRTDCCGSATIVGVNTASSSAFATCETAWDAHFPPCGCPSRPAQTEDGKTPSDPSKVVVECTNFTSSGGVCRTRTVP